MRCNRLIFVWYDLPENNAKNATFSQPEHPEADKKDDEAKQEGLDLDLEHRDKFGCWGMREWKCALQC